MELKDDQELLCTREKLRLLTEHIETSERIVYENEYVRMLSLRSLIRMKNQLTEEIIRYESRKKTASRKAVSHDA